MVAFLSTSFFISMINFFLFLDLPTLKLRIIIIIIIILPTDRPEIIIQTARATKN